MSVARGDGALQPQDLVLTIFGAYVRNPGDRVWSGGMVKILESLGFTTGSARAALARLVNRNLLARTREGRQAFYAVTQRADALLSEGDRRIFTFGRTDPAVDFWTVLWHAIPEDQRVNRARLASQLRFLGFGAVQDATWVAARNREREVQLVLHQLEITRYVSIMVGRMSPDVPPVALVAQAWRIPETRLRYESFLSDFGVFGNARLRKRLTSGEAFRNRTLMLHAFRGFPFMDPELPESIDSLRELRKQVVAAFDEVYAALEPEATKFFWRAVAPAERSLALSS